MAGKTGGKKKQKPAKRTAAAKPQSPNPVDAHLNRRLYARFPCKLPVMITLGPGTFELHGEVHDIGMGGALLRSPVPLNTKEVRVRFTIEGVECIFDGYIVRSVDNPRESGLFYGVEFHPNPDMEHKLKGLLPPKSP